MSARQNHTSLLSVLTIIASLLNGCTGNIPIASTRIVKTEQIPTPTPIPTPFLLTATHPILPTVTKNLIPTAIITQALSPTPNYGSIAGVAPGMYIEIKDYIRGSNGSRRYETGLISIDGVYKAHLSGNGGPIDLTGRKMVIWDSPTLDEVNCSEMRILDLFSQKIIFTDNHPNGYKVCESVTWSLDGKTLFFIGDSLDIAAYNPETNQTTQLIHDPAGSTNGFHLLALSPNGRYLAFYRDGWAAFPFVKDRWIYILDVSCQDDPVSCIRNVWVAFQAGGTSPISWMSDGSLTKFDDESGERFQVFDVSKGVITKIINLINRKTYADFVSWSPDGKWVAVSGFRNIYLISSSGGEPTSLSKLTGVAGYVLGWVVIPSKTPLP